MDRQKGLASVAILACVIAGFVWVGRALPAPAESPKAAAEQVRDAYLRMDGKALYARLSEAEKRVNNLTESKFIQLCDELIFPKVKTWKVNLGESLVLGRGEEGAARFDVELPNQPPFTQTLIVWVGPDGPATDSIADLLFPVYYAEGFGQEKRVRDARSGEEIRLAGLKRDRATLRKYGVNTFSGYSYMEGEYHSRDIDSMITDWEKRVSSSRAMPLQTTEIN